MHHDHDRVKLIISEAQAKDAGNYVLCAKNIAGIAFSSCDVAVQLEMTVDSEAAIKPTVLLPLKDVHSVEGKSVQLQCEISGAPEPEVSIPKTTALTHTYFIFRNSIHVEFKKKLLDSLAIYSKR